MADIGIGDIFGLIAQIIPYTIACLYYVLLAMADTIFRILDNIIWYPVSLIWNTIIDFLSFMQTFFDLTFLWGQNLIIIPCFFVCVTIFTVRLLCGIWYFIKKLIPVIG